MAIGPLKGTNAAAAAGAKGQVAALPADTIPGSLGSDKFMRSKPVARDGMSEEASRDIKRIIGTTLLGGVAGALSPLALGLIGVSMTLTGPAWAALIGIGAVGGLAYSLLKSKS